MKERKRTWTPLSGSCIELFFCYNQISVLFIYSMSPKKIEIPNSGVDGVQSTQGMKV